MTTYPNSWQWAQPAPEWLSLQLAAVIYSVSVDTLMSCVRDRVEDLDHMFRPIPTVRPAWRRRV